MKPLINFALIGLSCLSTPVWAAYLCDLKISAKTNDVNYTETVTIIPSSDPQAILPNTNEFYAKAQVQTISYWVKRRMNMSYQTIIFKPEASEFTADASNPKGWLVDSTVPGLYFTLMVNLPDTGSVWGDLNPMPIYLSNSTAINSAKAGNGGWGCDSATSDRVSVTGNMTFTLSFYTTSAFNPALAAGKQFLTTRKRAGTLENSHDEGGEFQVFVQGPISFPTASCGTFRTDASVDLGSLPLTTLSAKPNDVFNNTPFQITLKDCYAQPTLTVNFSSNQVKNNLLVNTKGTAKGVGVGIGYTTASNASQRLDLTKAVTISNTNMNYTNYNGDGVLKMFAVLGVTDKSTLTSGTVDIPAVITLTNP